jgi:multiple sugar transport system substrate-binding protein
MSRRSFLAGATSLGLLLAACTPGGEDGQQTEALPSEPPPTWPFPTSEPPPTETVGVAPSGEEAPLKEGLAEGMYGGVTGFAGAERYQYPLDSEEGRAIAGLRKLRQDGKAPSTIVVQVLDFARSQFETGFPEGAPSHLQLFEEETGIRIELVELEPAAEREENRRNAVTKNGSFDLVTTVIEEIGDLAEAGLLLPLDDFVATYQPEWTDPLYGYAGGATAAALFNEYRESTYAVAFDNDTQPFFYRADFLENPVEQASFEDKYGRPLRFPLTWDEHAEVAEFFTRRDLDPPLYGDVATLAPFWGVVNWYERFVCSAAPNMLYFRSDGSANVNNEAGVRAFAELLKALEWQAPGALANHWGDQYELMGSGLGWGGGSFPSLTKIVPGNGEYDTANIGQYIRSEIMPGRVVDGALVRRPVIFYNICYGVNAFADPFHREAAYLFLQWAGGARVHTWLAFNPRGFQDPHHTYSLDDPYVAASYKPQPTAQLKNIIPRTAPPITIKGGSAYSDALSEELAKVLTRQQTPEQGAKALEDRWNTITEEQGAETQAEALKTFVSAFPQVTDSPVPEVPGDEASTAPG